MVGVRSREKIPWVTHPIRYNFLRFHRIILWVQIEKQELRQPSFPWRRWRLSSANMKGSHPGEFEELLLLTVASLNDKAHGVAIREELRNKGKRTVAMSTIHITLFRLERKGLLQSVYHATTTLEAGRRKHRYQVTNAGYHAIEKVRQVREAFWSTIAPAALTSHAA